MSEHYNEPIDPSLADAFAMDHDDMMDYKKSNACDVCNAEPDEDGVIHHGRGCYVVDEDGGGETYVDPFGASTGNTEDEPS